MMENAAQDALQLEALLVSRSYLYTLFHKLLGGAPDDALLDALFGEMAADALDEFAGASDELARFGALLAAKRAERDADAAAFLEAAHDEYTRVLVGPLALPASPYESPYTGAHDMATFQQNTLDVRALYHADGLAVRREQAVPDDHVALLCAYAAALSKRALAALGDGDSARLAQLLRAQHAFVSAHLANWLGIYAASVRNSKAGAAAVLYPQLLEGLDAFTRADVEFLAESAYWAETEMTGGLEASGGVAPELAEAFSALGSLEELRPFGIQDNELVLRGA